jgi:hypothetical protein
VPITRPDQLPERGQRVQKIAAQSVGDDWTLHPFQLWGATKLTIWVGGNPVEVQLSRDQPPDPPTWDDPIPVSVGPWSHAGPFGYVRFRNFFKGAAGTIFGALYAE